MADSPQPEPTEPVHAALFSDLADAGFLRRSLTDPLDLPRALMITAAPGMLPDLPPAQRLTFADVALDAAPVEPEDVLARLAARLAAVGSAAAVSGLVVDMSWALTAAHGGSSLALWSRIAARLARDHGLPVISVYSHELMIEEQMQAALRAHPMLLAPSGLRANPFWIPATLLEEGTLDEQLSFLLGRAMPDYAGLNFFKRSEIMLARGATPSWLPQNPSALGGRGASAARWHVHCLGQLRVFVGDGQRINWHLPGGAPKKTRTLFAYLLQAGEKGAHADQIGELLWPDEGTEATKRARLHHTVAMLRKTLGDGAAVLRAGEYYRLNPPPGSWIDIDTFEQLCRRGLALLNRGQYEAALKIYAAAEAMYAGDLFEDLPVEYVQSEQEDWCIPRRTWLREMAMKLQYDFSRVLRSVGRTREALEHCQKALAIDPANEEANAETLRVYLAQGRTEAAQRHYRQFRAALGAIGASEGPEIKAIFRELSKTA